jgi:sugar phosphate isomerase/epimerase
MTNFSYQLYSSRNFPPLGDTLKMVADAGYAQVEGYGGLYEGAALAELTAGLEATGLTMPTGHMGFDMVRDTPDQALAIAKTLGMKAIFVPHLMPDERPTDAAGWAQFGRDLAEAGKPIMDAGLKFGWHNHDFEFVDLGGADRPLDLILQASDDLALEMDVAWVVRGGQDPMAWIKRYSDRLLSAHIKDIAAPGTCMDEDGWADVGHGTMDWPTLMTALKGANTTYFVMEHDNPNDHKRFATRAITAAQAM